MDKPRKILLEVIFYSGSICHFKSIQAHHRNKLREEFSIFKALTNAQAALSNYAL